MRWKRSGRRSKCLRDAFTGLQNREAREDHEDKTILANIVELLHGFEFHDDQPTHNQVNALPCNLGVAVSDWFIAFLQ